MLLPDDQMNSRSLTTFLASALLILCIPALPACSQEPETKAERVEREARELGEALADYTAEQKEEAVAKARRTLADLDERVNEMEARLRERWSDMDSATRDEAQERLDALRERRAEVAEWLGRLKGSSAEAWTHVRDGFSDAYSAFRKSWEDAEQEIDSEN